MKNTLFILSLFGALVAASFWWTVPSLPPLGEDDRLHAQARGEAHRFASLSDGIVHYRLEGPDGGPVVVLIHGFRIPSFVWDDHIAPLTGAGFQVLAFDNYGRGFSDRPDGPYSAERTDRLIMELLDDLAITRPVHLVGYSMGGATAAVFASRHPQKVRSLTLIAPAGTGERPGFVRLVSTPVLGDWIMTQWGGRMSRESAASSAAVSPDPDAFQARFEAQTRFAGYNEALLSTLRHYPLWDAQADFESIGKTALPVQILWGEEDSVVAFEQAAVLKSLLPQSTLHAFPDIGHSLTFSHPHEVSPRLVSFVNDNRLRRTSGGPGGKARGPEARMEPADCLCHADNENADDTADAL